MSALGFAFLGAAFALTAHAQAGDPGTLIKEKLVSQIKLTKAAAAHDDIVTAGDVVVLHKDGLMMCSSASSYAFSNTYSNGVLAANYNNRAKDAAKSFLKGKLPLWRRDGSVTDAASNGCAQREVRCRREVYWVTDINIVKYGIVVCTFIDPYNDTRYFGELKFPASPRAQCLRWTIS